MTLVDQITGRGSYTAVKAPCVTATTANITLSGAQTIDGIAVVAENRVLVKDQSIAKDNGIYIVSTGAWARANDANKTGDLVKGTRTYVFSGTVGAGEWELTSGNPVEIDTDAITWSYAASAINLLSQFLETSSTSFSIGTGSKVFTVSGGKAFVVGNFVLVTDDAAPTTNWMFGQITAYSGTSMTINVTVVAGSGTFTAWTISVSGARGATGATGGAGVLGVVTKTNSDHPYTAVAGDTSKVFLLDASSGVLTIALTAAGTLAASWDMWFIATDVSNAITIDPDGSETISGASTFVFGHVGQAIHVVCDGSNFHIMSSHEEIASQAEAEAGTDTAKRMTPLRVKQAIAYNAGWALIEARAISGSPSQEDFVSLSSYRDLRITIDGLSTAGAVACTLRVSTDNGSTYKAGSSDYRSEDGGNRSSIRIFDTLEAAENNYMTSFIFDLNDSARKARGLMVSDISFASNRHDTRAVAEANDAIRIIFGGSTADAGTLILQGRRV